MERMYGQPTIPDILLRIPPGTRTRICLRLLLSYLATSVSCDACQNVQADDWAFTTPYIHKFNYSWTINDWQTVALSLGYNHDLETPWFSPPSAPEFVFKLQLYPRHEKLRENVVVSFYYTKGPVNDLHYTAEFRVLDNKCKTAYSVNTPEDPSKLYKLPTREWFEQNANKVVTSGDQLRLVMTAEIHHTNHSYGGQCQKLAFDNASDECYLEKYRSQDAYADGEIVTKDGVVIPVHKVLMAAQSTVLAEAYLTNDTYEADDIDRATMVEVLCYLYCNKPHHMDERAIKLLAAANSLKIHGLKLLCEAELCGSINANNAYEIYVVAIKYNAEGLRKKAAEYIAANQAEVMKSNSFREISQQHPVCVSDLLTIK